MDEQNEQLQGVQRRDRLLAGVMLVLCLVLIVLLCVGLVRLLLYQGREMDVSVDTSGDAYTESVSVTVTNVLGMDLLIAENAQVAPMLQYFDGSDWTDVCELRFGREDASVISGKYGGQYIHLPPGGVLQYRLDEQRLADLPSGEYRVAVLYISEDAYLSYLQERAGRIEASLAAEDAMAEDTSDSESAAESGDGSEASAPEEDETSADEPRLRLFYTAFRFTCSADASGNTSANVDVSVGLE